MNTTPFPKAHFATFPCELIQPCILAGSEPGDLVLDPFFGAGTVGVVCREMQRMFVGLELKREYAEIAATRLGWPMERLETYGRKTRTHSYRCLRGSDRPGPRGH